MKHIFTDIISRELNVQYDRSIPSPIRFDKLKFMEGNCLYVRHHMMTFGIVLFPLSGPLSLQSRSLPWKSLFRRPS
jgi:hypothetical protein